MRKAFVSLVLWAATLPVAAQLNGMQRDGNMGMPTTQDNRTVMNRDTTSSNKEIPMGLKVWTVDERFGDRMAATADTLHYMFMNSIFTTGLRSEYNSLGNLGSPREHRVFIDRQQKDQFIFTQPYDYFITPVDKFHFTNTLSPITNLAYNTCGDRNNGEDHFKALFGVNAGKRIGLGFKFDYIYGRGYYQNQSTAHFNYTMYGSYLGDHYEAHLLLSTNHQKVSENGGIANDDYITHPEVISDKYRTNEIPTMLAQNWNRNDNQHVFLTHRYNIGFNRKVPMTEEEIKAKKFAMASQKEQDAKKAREEAMKLAKKEGREWNEEEYQQSLQKKDFGGRPDDAKIAGKEPVAAADTTATNGQGRIKVGSKEEADRLLAEDKTKEKEDTAWLKDEFVPVTSFIHTAKFDNYRRIFQAYQTPDEYYANRYNVVEKLGEDSIYDKMKHYRLKNTLAIALLEGFNKWAKAGLKGFITSDLRHFTLPAEAADGDTLPSFTSFNEHTLSVGGQLSKTQGSLLHYNATVETWILGEDAGQLKIDGAADLNFRLFGDTVQLAASGFLHNINPTFFYRHYQSRHLWWNNDKLDKETRLHLEGRLTFGKTNTRLRVAFDDIKNYTYFGQDWTVDGNDRGAYSIAVRQHSGNMTVLTAQLDQRIRLGVLNWESVVTWQKSSNNNVLPLPSLNIYTNLFFKFNVANVLNIDLGADLRYFSKYYAHDYCPALSQFTVQENTEHRIELGNYPIVNVYANMDIKHTRFFFMMSHVNAGKGNKNYFFAPHYPLNGNLIRFGISWNFFN